jgi:hypothetical protein
MAAELVVEGLARNPQRLGDGDDIAGMTMQGLFDHSLLEPFQPIRKGPR